MLQVIPQAAAAAARAAAQAAAMMARGAVAAGRGIASTAASGGRAMVAGLKEAPGSIASGFGDIAAAFPKSTKLLQNAAKPVQGAAKNAATWAKQQGANAARAAMAPRQSAPAPPAPSSPAPAPAPPAPSSPAPAPPGRPGPPGPPGAPPPPTPAPPGGNSPPAGNNPGSPFGPRRGGGGGGRRQQNLWRQLGMSKLVWTPSDVADVVKASASVVKGLVMLPKHLKDFGASVLEAKRHLGELHSGANNTFAKLDAERLGRNARMAAGTAGSTAGLARAQSKLEERLLPVQIGMSNVMNLILEFLINKTGEILEALKMLIPEKDRKALEGLLESQARVERAIVAREASAMTMALQGIADRVSKRKSPPKVI